MRDPNTFSSELGDVHEHRSGSGHDSFSSEFRGASDSLLDANRPARVTDIGRRSRRVVWTLLILVVVFGFGGWAFWYWSAEIGGWIAGLGGDDQAEDDAEPEAEVAPPPDLPPADPEPDKVFGIRGNPGSDSAADSGAAAADSGQVDAPAADTGAPAADSGAAPEVPSGDSAATGAAPQPTPTPAGQAKLEIASTKVSGKVSGARVSTNLAKTDDALRECWTAAVGKGEAGPVELQLSFKIRWNGRRGGVTVTGGSETVKSCVRKAVPSGGWPQPRDGGEAKVTRTWTLSS